MRGAIYNASAGSGKTYRLAYKYVRDVIGSPSPSLYRNILAVTFTNKATEEMKRRILMQIHALASGAKSSYIDDLTKELALSEYEVRRRAKKVLSHILHGYSRFTVLTIDRFFQRILRAFIMEVGLDIAYSLEIENASIIEQGVDSLIDEIASDKTLHKWLIDTAIERISEGKKWDVRDSLLQLSEELFKPEARKALERNVSREELSSAIGKRTLELKIFNEKIEQMASEALRQIEAEGLTCDSFKGSSRSVAQIFRKIASRQAFKVTATQRKATQSEDEWCSKSAKGLRPSPQLVASLQIFLRELIELIDENEKTSTTTSLMRENYRNFALLGDIYKRVESICNNQNIVLLNQTANILKEFINESDAPFIYEKVGNRYSHFMIDEFQDTSRHEWRNFLPLLLNALAESEEEENRILIVGDIKQSIYRWRGGDWRLLHSEALAALGEEQIEVHNMADNYRSLKRVVEFNNEMIERVVKEQNTHLNEALSNGNLSEQVKSELRGMLANAYEGQAQNPRRKADHEGFVEVLSYLDIPPLVRCICSAIDRGYRPCDIMILARTKRETREIARILMDFKRGNREVKYHFDVMTQEALVIGSAPASRFIIALMQLALNPEDRLALAAYNQFLNNVDVDLPLDEEQLNALGQIRSLSPLEAFERIVADYPSLGEKSNVSFVQAIHEQIINFSNTKVCDLALFCDWWLKNGHDASLNVEQSQSAIEVLTIHKAKGLEKSVVIIPYCNWQLEPRSRQLIWASDKDGNLGQLPINYKADMGKSDFAQEYFREMVYSHIDSVNLLYVALTRAAESLHVFVPCKLSSKGERVAQGIGKVVLECAEQMDSTKKLTRHIANGVETETITYEFGVQATSIERDDDEKAAEVHIIDTYKSHPASLKLSMPSTRYREQSCAPREIGVLLHKAFESARSIEDIEQNMSQMLSSGLVDASEKEQLQQVFEQSIQNPIIRSWFSADWDEVRNECDILSPSGEYNMRPDRVMSKDGLAVVVDYKFGRLHSARYAKQMARYKRILLEMGYKQVEAYIWYIRSGEVELI